MTLIVSLDSKGKATGTMYEDAGDGYQYQKGEYLVSGFTAKKSGSAVEVVITVGEGKLKPSNRKYKIIVVTDSRLVESV